MKVFMMNLLTISLVLSYSVHIVVGSCPHGIMERGVSENEKNFIVEKHNEYRRLVKRGQLEGQPQATRMYKMKWDETIACEAQKNADTCVYGHNNVSDARWPVGQNIYTYMSTEDESGSDWKACIKAWFDEYKIYKYPTFTHETGHYTQIVWADTYLVGCGYTYYQADEKLPYHKYYVCNYGPAGNIIGRPPYQTQKRKRKSKKKPHSKK